MNQRIDSSALISPEAKLGDNITVMRGAQIWGNVTLGDNTFVGPNVVLGEPTSAYYRNPDAYRKEPISIGEGSILRTGTIIYDGVRIGSHLQTGPYAVIRENTVIGNHCSFGNNCDIQADVTVGNYTRCHSNVTLGQYSVIGNYCWFMPYVILMNDVYPPNYFDPSGPKVGDFTVLGGRVVVFPVRIGVHVVAAAQSQLTTDIEDFSLVRGIPAERIGDCRHIVATRKDGTKYRPYPWPQHHRQRYSFTEEDIKKLDL